MEEDADFIEGRASRAGAAYYRNGAYRAAGDDGAAREYIAALEAEIAMLKRRDRTNTLGLIAYGGLTR